MKLTDEQLELAIKGQFHPIERDVKAICAELLTLRREWATAERRFALAKDFTAAALTAIANDDELPDDELALGAVLLGLATADEFLRRIGEGEGS